MKLWGRGFPGAYGAYGVYTNAARFGAFRAFGGYDYAGAALGAELGAAGMGSAFGAGGGWPPAPPGSMLGGPGMGVPGAGGAGGYGSAPLPPPRGLGTKIFVGRLPPDATAEDLRRYFNNFGRIVDVYVPKVRFCTHFDYSDHVSMFNAKLV